MGLVATVEPGISAFDTLLQNGAERQAGYERPLSPPRPCMSRRTLLSPEQRARLFAVPTSPAEMARHYVLSAKDLVLVPEPSAAPSIGWASPYSSACCGIPARG